MAKPNNPYGEGRAPSKAGHGHYHREDVKLSRDSRLTPEGNYREKPRSLANKADNVSGMGLSRPVSRGKINRY
jgi:hypothetical protein